MKHKPLLFTILSILCLIEPLFKLIYFKVTTHFDFLVIFSNLMSRNSMRDVFDFWIVFPLAGLFLIRIRWWTYLSFMSLLIYIVYGILTYEKYTWPYYSDSPFLYHYVVVFTSLAVFIYFLMPRVREPFFNTRVRWWETKARYPVAIECGLKNEHLAIQTEIINISQTGAFVKENPRLKIGDKLNMDFDYQGNQISVPVEIIHRHKVDGHEGYGVKFELKSFRQTVQISKLIAVVKRSKAPR